MAPHKTFPDCSGSRAGLDFLHIFLPKSVNIMWWKTWPLCTTCSPSKKEPGNKEYILIARYEPSKMFGLLVEQNRHGSTLTDLQSSRKENQPLTLNNYISLKYTKGTKQYWVLCE